MNNKWNNISKLLKMSCIIGLPIILQSFATHRNNIRKVQRIEIFRVENPIIQYITNDAIESLLFATKNAEEHSLKELKISLLEKQLDASPMVEKADIYLTIDGILKIVVKQREPIARIYANNQFYYMDMQGDRMPLSNAYSARVPIVRGVTETVWQDAYHILKYIYTDQFLKENIVEIISEKGTFSARMRDTDFLVYIGNSDDIHMKFNNLKSFYKKASKDHFLDKYAQINLQYTNQVVCVKANNTDLEENIN